MGPQRSERGIHQPASYAEVVRHFRLIVTQQPRNDAERIELDKFEARVEARRDALDRELGFIRIGREPRTT